MINVNVNTDGLKDLQQKIQALKDNPDPVLRACAMALTPEIIERVHIKGLDSSGSPIGTYSPGYMAVRTGNYQNSKKVSRGVNKGKLKDSGTFTKGAETRVGLNRPNHHRTADTKVILSLTKQMENDLSVIDTETGYGIGYLNPLNYKKALWCEDTYKKPILTKLTAGEEELAEQTAINFLPGYLKLD
jgi:hypothetical protein